MKALILAAGLGSRLKNLTKSLPKALVKYRDREILDYQIDALLSEGIYEITIVSGYRSDILTKFLKNKYSDANIRVVENKIYNKSNSAYSSMKALSLTDTDYLHLNCDILFSKKILRKLINSDNENIIAVRKDLAFSDAMENVISLKGRIVNMSLRNTSLTSYKAYGLAKISNDALKENISIYDSLSKKTQLHENYFGLIRRALGKVDYNYLETDRKNLAEINTIEDLKVCTFKETA